MIGAQIAFGLTAAYIDEGITHGVAADERRRACEAVRQAVAAAGPDIPFHSVPLEDVFSSKDDDSEPRDTEEMLLSLLQVCGVLTIFLPLK